MTNEELATKILEYVGGKENVNHLTHCVTRLRFNLVDDMKVNTSAIENLEGIIGIQNKGGQFQVIIGNRVNKVYAELEPLLGLTAKETVVNEENSSWISRLFKTISSILIPSLPPIIGGGMIKGLLYMFWQFGMMEMGTDLFNLFDIVSDGMFYFFPFLLAVSAAEVFKTNKYMALAIAGSFMHPIIFQGISDGVANLISFGGISIPNLDYSSSVVPIILSVWILSYVYRFFERKIPDIVSVIFTPMLTLLIVVPISLAFIAPLGFYFGEYLALGIQKIIDFNPMIAGFVIGFLRPFTVFTGTHHAVRAIVAQQLATYSYTTIGAMNYMSTMAQAAAPVAIYFILKNKNKKMGQLSLSSAISGFLGVTEPGLYGIIMKYRVAFIAVSIGGGIGSAISAYFGGAEYALVMSSLVTIPATFGDGFIGIAIGLPVSVVVTMLIIFTFKDKIIAEDLAQQKKSEETQMIHVATSQLDEKVIPILSPVEGGVMPLNKVADKAFSEGEIGKGIGISPLNNEIQSPVNGVITAIYPTKHAIGITSEQGVEILIHIGIDTVNLGGKYFNQFVKQNEIVQEGQSLMTFDKEAIKEKGYILDVIMVVLNTDDYLDVIPNLEKQQVKTSDVILDIII
ncbi:PTS glucose transporter subunit IIA [Enterococcus saccharolyticus]|uniref:glucose PTS transporter subunit IIA n=1 Tax=Enterococcus saccharolyticus TaxID=41997 RepID=UPI001E620504|nr:glucose PTS transporter subunit IIA [Enterococcus saccharolyticus]MCD5002366.1 PTS glucose transporter subunit IIA [Enterococcus saccharolyticus]